MTAKKMQKRLFGTNGVRGVAGQDLTPELVFSIGKALGYMRKGRIAVGRDTRTSGETLAKALNPAHTGPPVHCQGRVCRRSDDNRLP